MSDSLVNTFASLVTAAIAAVSTGPSGRIDLPQLELVATVTEPVNGFDSDIVGMDGSYVGHVASQTPVPLTILDLPQEFVEAVVEIEDRRFYRHKGIDFRAALSAALATANGNTRGGSTLTQQLIKGKVTGSERSLRRKTIEAILATRIETAVPKEIILKAYLEGAWFGRGVTGAARAPQVWFGKEWSKLSLGQVTYLAGILKGAGQFDSIADSAAARHFSQSRRDLVLNTLLERGKISKIERDEALVSDLNLIPRSSRQIGDLWVLRAVAREIGLRSEVHKAIAHPSFKIVTHIDQNWQTLIQEVLRSELANVPRGAAGFVEMNTANDGSRSMLQAASSFVTAGAGVRSGVFLGLSPSGGWLVLSSKGHRDGTVELFREGYIPLNHTPRAGEVFVINDSGKSPSVETTPLVQAAVVLLDPTSGAVLATVGGLNPEVSEFDRSRAMRQPGSAIKPFLWMAALKLGVKPDSVLSEDPKPYPSAQGFWTPKNFGGNAAGNITMFRALEQSSNRAAVDLAAGIGIAAMAEVAQDLGVYSDTKMELNLTSALGSSATTLINLCSGYAAIVNGGHPVVPHVIAGLSLRGEVSIGKPQRPLASLDSASLSAIQSMMRGVVTRGTAESAFRGHPVAIIGKTGTSQDHRDSWFFALTPDFVLGVWLGRDDNTPLPGAMTGGSGAGRISARILSAAFEANLIDGNGNRDGTDSELWPPLVFEP